MLGYGLLTRGHVGAGIISIAAATIIIAALSSGTFARARSLEIRLVRFTCPSYPELVAWSGGLGM